MTTRSAIARLLLALPVLFACGAEDPSGLPKTVGTGATAGVGASGAAGAAAGGTAGAGGTGGSNAAGASGSAGASPGGAAGSSGVGNAGALGGGSGTGGSAGTGTAGAGAASGGGGGTAQAGAAGGAAGAAGGGTAGASGSAGQSGGGAGSAGSAGAPPISDQPTIYIASDSTASTYAASTTQGGWGQFLADHFDSSVKVDNRSRGGRTARRFIDAEDEQSLDRIYQVIKPGDYLFVQFGTNDSNSTAMYTNVDGDSIPYYLDPDTDFKTWLRVYVDGAREHEATPVFVTPPPRRSCSGDSHDFGNGTARWATAMKELASETGTAVIDLNQKTLDYLNMIGCLASAEFFFDDGTRIDGTHFSKTGAALMAGFVADGVRKAALPVAQALK